MPCEAHRYCLLGHLFNVIDTAVALHMFIFAPVYFYTVLTKLRTVFACLRAKNITSQLI